MAQLKFARSFIVCQYIVIVIVITAIGELAISDSGNASIAITRLLA